MLSTAASRERGLSGSAGGGGTSAPASPSSPDSGFGTPATVMCSGGAMSATSGSAGQEPTGIIGVVSPSAVPAGSGGAPPAASKDGGRVTWGNGSRAPARASGVPDTPLRGVPGGPGSGDP